MKTGKSSAIKRILHFEDNAVVCVVFQRFVVIYRQC